MTGGYGGEGSLPEAMISDGWADGSAGDCSRWPAVAVTEKPDDSGGSSSPRGRFSTA
jgi:hypothetical protein